MIGLTAQGLRQLSRSPYYRSVVQQPQFRFAMQSFVYERPFLTSNKFVLIQNPIDDEPYIQLKANGAKIKLQKDMTLTTLESKLKTLGESSKGITFCAPDGALISKCTKLHHILHIPYFVMRVDEQREYNVMSEKSFSLRNTKFTLNSTEKVVYDNCKSMNMRDQKAIEISKFLSQFQKELSAKPEWSQNEILIMIREVLAMKAKNVKEEKEVLSQQLVLLKRQRQFMFTKLNEIQMRANTSARRVLLGFASVFVTQYFLTFYGTYIAFSWDIMEPITCGFTLGDTICAYFFWIWSKKPYSINGLRDFFYERRKGKLIKKLNLDYDNFQKTEEAIRIIKERLKELE